MELFKYGDIVGRFYAMEYKDELGEIHVFKGLLENFSPSGKVALHGYTGMVVVDSARVVLLRPLSNREIEIYENWWDTVGSSRL